MTKANKTAADVALEQLMRRLAALGLATLATLCIVIVSTSVYTTELSHYSPAFATYFICIIEQTVCVDCSFWSDLAKAPSPGVLGLQLFAESCIVVLFGFFFASQSLSRMYKNWTNKSTDVVMVRSGGLEHYNETFVNSSIAEDSSGPAAVDVVRHSGQDKRVGAADS